MQIAIEMKINFLPKGSFRGNIFDQWFVAGGLCVHWHWDTGQGLGGPSQSY